MKSRPLGLESNPARFAVMALGAVFLCGVTAFAEAATPQDETAFNNWITPSFGGLIINGNQAQFQQANPTTGPVNGGIQDMHYQQDLKNNSFFKIDGHALFDNNDYKVILELSQQDLGYIKAGYTGFTSYFNGNGGYLAPTAGLPNTMTQPGAGLFFPGPEYGLYRGSLWAEIGLRKEALPELTLRYEHNIRNGQEDTTSWGMANTRGVAAQSGGNANRAIVPGFWNINEVRDIFNFNGKQLFGKPDAYGNTEVNLNARYEAYTQNDSLNTHNNAFSTSAPGSSGENFMTQKENQNANNYSGNLSTVTRFGDKFWVTTGYAYAAMTTDLGGSRTFGPAWGLPYAAYYQNGVAVPLGGHPPGVNTYQSSSGFQDLGGGSDLKKNTMLLNIRWVPIDGLEITPSARLDLVSTVNNSVFTGERTPAAANGWTGFNGTNSHVNSSVFLNDFAQALDIRYTKIRDWVIYGDATWDQQNENRGYNTPLNSSQNYQASQITFQGNNTWGQQKYTGGVNWYPLMNLNAGAQFYWLFQNISQQINTDNTSNQRLLGQYWNTQDANFRVTWTPFSCVSLVSRYDLQLTSINSEWAATGAAGANPMPSGLSSQMKSQILSENLSWTPVERMFLQGNFSYVINQLTSPAVNANQSLQAANNNYWTAGLGAGYQLDSKTSVRSDFNLYYASNYQNNEQIGMPYNASATQYTFSASLNRQITRSLTWSLKYYFDTYQDRLSGGNNSYTAQIIATSMNMQF